MKTSPAEQMFFLATEHSISEQRGIEINYPIRLFTLDGIGVDEERFVRELGPTFGELPWDHYDEKRMQVQLLMQHRPEAAARLTEFVVDYYAGRKGLTEVSDLVSGLLPDARKKFDGILPYRRRTVARFALVFVRWNNTWVIHRLPNITFKQNVPGSDIRSLERVFADMSDDVVNHPEFAKFLCAIAEIVRSVHPVGTNGLVVAAHQVRTIARPGKPGDNAPEGIHQDGADYIVSALEVAQKGSTAGMSMVFGPDQKTEYLRVNLGPAQGVFQADTGSPLWHDVTPIEVEAHVEEGVRDIFGLDIRLI